MDSIFKPTNNNKAGKVLFYIFEIAAAAIGFILFILSIVSAIDFGTFMTFVDGFINAVIMTLVLYGIGRIIDLLFAILGKKND